MGTETGIGWTDMTWSPWRGCSKVSEGCTNCYAEVLSRRNPGILGVWGPSGSRVVTAESGWRQVLAWQRRAAADGVRRRVFPSLCDPFEDRPELAEPRARFWRLVADTPDLDWLVLTKRPENFLKSCGGNGAFVGWTRDGVMPPNLWLGVSAEDQRRADERIPYLLDVPARVRFVSYEPALGPVDWEAGSAYGYEWDYLTGEKWSASRAHRPLRGIDWVICGGESGPGRRPCEVGWFRRTADQCRYVGVACFIKQDSSYKPGQQGRIPDDLWSVKQIPSVPRPEPVA